MGGDVPATFDITGPGWAKVIFGQGATMPNRYSNPV